MDRQTADLTSAQQAGQHGFLQVICHEAGNPLATVQGALDMFTMEPGTSPTGKLTESGSIVVTVSTQIEAPGGQPKLRVVVEGAGCGISMREPEQLFGPFSKSRAALTRSPGGAGLSIVIARLSALLRGGSLQLQSEAEKGVIVLLEDPGSSGWRCAKLSRRAADAAVLATR